MRYVFIVVLMLLAGIIVINMLSIDHLKDEELTPEAKALFAPDPINLENNFLVAWSGIYAPSEEMDLYGFGVKAYQGRIDRRTLKRVRFQNDIKDGKRHCGRQSGYYKHDDHYAYDEVCYTADELAVLYTQNEQLVFRYKNLLRDAPSMLVSAGDRQHIGVASTSDIMSMQGLLLDLWISQAREGQGEAALKGWMISMRAFQHIISGKLDVLDHLGWGTVYSMNLNGLPAILEADPTLISKYGSALRDILDFDYMVHLNVEAMLRVEVMFFVEAEKQYGLQPSMFYAPNMVRNSAYELSQRVVALSKMQAKELYYGSEDDAPLSECSLFKLQYCLPHYLIVNEMTRGFSHYHSIFTHAHGSMARQKELIIWMDAHTQNIPSEDMAVFLEKAEKDPINNQSFLWDNDKKCIYHQVPDEYGVLQQRDAVYY